MDAETILLDCAFLAVDFCFLGIFYKMYRNKSDCLKSLQEAQCLEVNKDLSQNVQNQNGVIPYAVISGNVKALSVPLRSKHFNYLQGVIQERITKEHKIRWNAFLHIWTTTDNDIKRNIASIPFGLSSGSNSLFTKSISVEVLDPLSSQELTLSTIYDDFKVHENSFGEAIFGFVRGERTVGVVEVENMLLENTSLTAIGKLIIENGNLKITPPEKDLTYFLTPLSFESLVKKINDSVKLYKGLTLFMCAVSFTLLVYVSKKWFVELKRRVDHAKRLKKCEEERRLRRTKESSESLLDSSNPKCVVCLENPIEILILECGHACLCFNCSERINNQCPVCRTQVQRLVAAFLP